MDAHAAEDRRKRRNGYIFHTIAIGVCLSAASMVARYADSLPEEFTAYALGFLVLHHLAAMNRIAENR